MAVMNRASFPRQLEEGLNTVFGMEYDQLPEEWTGVFDVEGSTKAYEEDVLMYGFGAAPTRGEGAPLEYDEAGEAWTARYVHEKVSMGFAITEEAIDDNQYGRQAPKLARALARAMKETKEVKGAAILNNAFDANFVGGDGVPLLANNHPLAGGGTASNILATPADIAETSLEALLIQIKKAVDDRLIPIMLTPQDIVLPVDTMFDIVRLLNSQYRPGTDLNDVNAMREYGFFNRGPRIMRRIVDADSWYIKTDCPDGMKHFRRKAMKTGSQGDFETDNYRYKASERYSFGWSDWRGLWGSPGAA